MITEITLMTMTRMKMMTADQDDDNNNDDDDDNGYNDDGHGNVDNNEDSDYGDDDTDDDDGYGVDEIEQAREMTTVAIIKKYFIHRHQCHCLLLSRDTWQSSFNSRDE